MSHSLIPTKSLTLETDYNVRTAKEVAANSADVERQMEAQGDKTELFPVRFVRDGDKLYVRNHATFLAAKARGFKQVYAQELPWTRGSVDDVLDLISSNNAGHPISRVQQGHAYKRLQDGVIDEAATAKAQKDAKVGEEVPTVYLVKPMSIPEIAKACKPQYSEEQIRQCIVLAESSPEVGQMLEDGKVSANIVIQAKQIAGDDDAKQLRLLKKAHGIAKDDGKDKATAQHLKAAKDELFPKKLIADGKATPAKGSEGSNGAKNDQEGQDEAPASGAGASDEGSESTDTGETGDTVNPLADDLFNESVQVVAKKDPRAALIAIIDRFLTESGNTFTDDEIAQLADSIIDAKLPI